MGLVVKIVFVFYLHSAASFLNLSDAPCGHNKYTERHAKIIGGADALRNEFPWIVSLTRHGGHFCGGIIINKRWILTAGHCLCTGKNSYFSSNTIKIRVGQHDLREDETEMRLRGVHVHPDYDCRYTWKDDIALLELLEDVTWSDDAQPSCFFNTDVDVENATVAGWGTINEEIYTRPDILQKAGVNLIENSVCNEWISAIPISKSQMCAGYEQGGTDACFEDSGGPLMIHENKSNRLVTVGIVSTGIGCARPRLPGIYTRISEYLPWIEHIITR